MQSMRGAGEGVSQAGVDMNCVTNIVGGPLIRYLSASK